MKTPLCLVAVFAAGVAFADVSGASLWHVVGGTPQFVGFLRALRGDGGTVREYPDAGAMPFDEASEKDVFFMLPCYGRGDKVLEEPDFDRLPGIRRAMEKGAGFYVENYNAQEFAKDGRHSDLTGFQILGGPRRLYQEYVVWRGMPLQARDGFYLPATRRCGVVEATVENCIGTRRVSVPGALKYPVLTQGRTPRTATAAFDLSRFDPLFRRPRAAWRDLLAETLSRPTGISPERVAEAFDAYEPYAEPLRLSHGRSTDEAVRRAVEWHFRSGLMRSRDGSKGVFEMIRSNDLGVRRSLRTDVNLLTGALLVDAGQKYGNAEWSAAGRRVADSILARGVQTPEGFFRWYEGCDDVWASDASRSGLALVNLWKATGNGEYLARAKRLGDAFLRWLGDERICGGWFDLKVGMHQRGKTDNPVFYGEMVPFLLQLGEKRYTAAATGVVERVMRRFPDVTPFGFSDNFTYSRALLMLAAAQYATDADYSEKINLVLGFFMRLRHRSGGLAESPIRLENHTEAGVGMGDGSDAVADLLYCNNVVYGAADILSKLPPERRRGVDVEAAASLAKGLRDFFLDIQISSGDPRFDGGWMRAYDLEGREYFGLNKDMDWGSYCIMGGWVMGFVPAILMNDGGADSWYFVTRR